MRIMVLGLRGFPHVEGGVETHAEHLYPLLARKGCEIEIVARTGYLPENIGSSWCGIKISRIFAPKSSRVQGLEAFIHSFLGIWYAMLKRPDILHIHSIGNGIFTPLARMVGLRVVTTHHGQEYEREKWGAVGRLILRTGEVFLIRFSNRCIVISKILEERVGNHFKRECWYIPNGVKVLKPIPAGKAIRKFDLTPRRYVLMVSRIDRVKRQLDLIKAFSKSKLKDWNLVLVGCVDRSRQYDRDVIAESKKTPNVIMAGFQTGEDLQELYSNAGIFVLPSSQEGFSMVLLEALSYGLPVIASAIPGNLLMNLPAEHYYPLGNVAALAAKLQEFSFKKLDENWLSGIYYHLKENHNWENIADKTLAVYSNLLQKRNERQ